VKILNLTRMENALIEELKVRNIDLEDLESVAGIDTVRILKKIAKNLGIQYVDINSIDIDYKL